MDQIVIVVVKSVFCQEAGGNPLCCVCVNVDEPTHHDVSNQHQNDIVPPCEASHSFIGIDLSQKVSKCCQKDRGYESIVFNQVKSSHKLFSSNAKIVTFSPRVAER